VPQSYNAVRWENAEATANAAHTYVGSRMSGKTEEGETRKHDRKECVGEKERREVAERTTSEAGANKEEEEKGQEVATG